MMLYDWLAICACLFLVNDVKTLSGTVDGNADRKDQESKSNLPKRYRRNADSVKKEYGELKYSGYLEGNAIKRADINGAFGVTAEKRTIKIGNQVCGSIKDANAYERTWRRLKGNEISDVKKVHKCCWSHNRCPRIVPAKATKFGFNNDLEYDIMECYCDTIFKKCLKDEKSDIADAIGHVYFDTLKIPCLTFSKDNQIQSQRPFAAGHVVTMEPDVQIPSPVIGAGQMELDSNDLPVPRTAANFPVAGPTAAELNLPAAMQAMRFMANRPPSQSKILNSSYFKTSYF